MKRKSTFLLGLSFMAFLSAYSMPDDEVPQTSYLYLVYTDNQEQKEISLATLSTLRSLTFNIDANEQVLQAHLKNGTSKTYDINTIDRLYFGYSTSSIHNTGNTHCNLYIENGMLYINGIADGIQVTIYSIDGKIIKSFTTSNTPPAVSELPQGLYLVKTNGQTFKLLKR